MVVIITISTALLALLAETLHFMRCRRVARLAFVHPQRGASVVCAAAGARIVGLTAVAAAIVLLWDASDVVTNAVGAVADEGERDRMIIVLDASKSMNIDDAGPDGNETRAERARELIRQLISQSNRMPRTTLVAFGESAIPVVYDAKSWDVLSSVLITSYYTQSFTSERTAVDDALHYAFGLAEDWVPNSTVVVLVTDGGSPASLDRFDVPPSVRRFVALGVGSSEGRAAGKNLTEISRLEEANLVRVAGLAGGDFINGNRERIAPEIVDALLPPPQAVTPESRVDRSLGLFGFGASLLAAVPFALSFASRRVMH